ncbi:MAG: glycosyltransferase [Anaerolineales bacterium]|nr:glycosyltransferase [Anaerolineales bacterium]
MPINNRSNYLTILIATYNRLEALKVVIDAIHAQTTCSHEIIVIDGGSTDGTIEYLESRSDITPVFQGKLLGAPRSYNEVWRQVESKYTAWLSDDTELTNNGLDLAVQILENDPEIGMVGLKTRDVIGPRTVVPYVGALSMFRILNCNHGVMPTEVARSVGFFNEDYPMYMIDPDLTASILCTGKKVVMTKPVCVLHRPEWALQDKASKKKDRLKGVDHLEIYRRKFFFLEKRSLMEQFKRVVRFAFYGLYLNMLSNAVMKMLVLNSRDWQNLTKARFIHLFDPIKNRSKPYHNEQQIYRNILLRPGNPYRHLVK